MILVLLVLVVVVVVVVVFVVVVVVVVVVVIGDGSWWWWVSGVCMCVRVLNTLAWKSKIGLVRKKETTIRYRRSLNRGLCRLHKGGRSFFFFASFSTSCEFTVFAFWKEFGRKAETQRTWEPVE